MNHLRMDLKVCEGCGGLWIRAGKEEGVYCRRCSVKLAEFPTGRPKRRRVKCGGRPRKNAVIHTVLPVHIAVEGGAR